MIKFMGRTDKIECRFISVWGEGFRFESKAMFDFATGLVTDIEQADVPEELLQMCSDLTAERIRFEADGALIVLDVVPNDDGSYSALIPFDVFYVRNGYAEIRATSWEEAEQLAYELKHDEILWDDDWQIDSLFVSDRLQETVQTVRLILEPWEQSQQTTNSIAAERETEE